MGPAGPPLLLGVLLLLSTALTEDVKINTFVGEMVQMTPVFDGVPQAFEWKKGTDKIIEVDFPHDPVPYILFTNRSHLNNTAGDLTIKDLQLTDSGEYSAHVLVNQMYQKTTFQLLVFPALNKPTVNCTGANTGVVIRCHHDPDPPTYEWYSGGQPVSRSLQNSSLADGNRSLTVGHADWKSLRSLECVVKNPATENRTSVPESCFEKGSQGNLRSGLIAAVVIVPLVLVIIYGFFYFMRKRKRGFFNRMRKRIQGSVDQISNRFHGSVDQISNRFHGYQTTATNDPGIEGSKGKGIRIKDGKSDDMNKDVATKENDSSSETKLTVELHHYQDSHKVDGGYQTTATNDPGTEESKGKGIRSKDGKSDDMNKDVATKENESSSETKLTVELHHSQDSHKVDGDGSADEGAVCAPDTPPADSKTHQNERELVKELQNQHDPPPPQTKESLNSKVS